jgi:DNA-binding transcriptional MerR regulator
MRNGADHSTDKLAPKQAAAVIGISLRQLAAWRKKKIGPPWRQRETNRIYYLREDIEAWENGHIVR